MFEVPNAWIGNIYKSSILLVSILLVGLGCNDEAQLANGRSENVPYKYRGFSFSFNNFTSSYVHGVLGVVEGRIGCSTGKDSGNKRGSGESALRRDCTPEALLQSPGELIWWKKNELADGENISGGPKDEAKRYRDVLPFPNFDIEAKAWRCHYSLQKNNTWVGRFEGCKPKAISAKAEPPELSDQGKKQSWIHFQFQSLVGKEIYFDYRTNKLISEDAEIRLFFPHIPGDGQFHCISAHSQEGSIYRPKTGSKIVFEWALLEDGKKEKSLPHQEFELPDFSNDVKNWYCYFTLGKDEKWTAVYEGVEKEN